MPSDISAIFWPYVIFFELFYERHILVLSFVALIISFLLYAYSIIWMVSDNWTPLALRARFVRGYAVLSSTIKY